MRDMVRPIGFWEIFHSWEDSSSFEPVPTGLRPAAIWHFVMLKQRADYMHDLFGQMCDLSFCHGRLCTKTHWIIRSAFLHSGVHQGFNFKQILLNSCARFLLALRLPRDYSEELQGLLSSTPWFPLGSVFFIVVIIAISCTGIILQFYIISLSIQNSQHQLSAGSVARGYRLCSSPHKPWKRRGLISMVSANL